MIPNDIFDTLIGSLAIAAVKATTHVTDGDEQTRQLIQIKEARDYLKQLQTQPRWEPITDESITRTVEIIIDGLDEYAGCRLCRLVQQQPINHLVAWCEDALEVIARGVDLMPLEQLSQWRGVRYVQEMYDAALRGEYLSDAQQPTEGQAEQ